MSTYEIINTAHQTLRIDARRYADYDDRLAAAAADAAREYGCPGYDLSPRWDDEQRDTILVDVPQSAVARTRLTGAGEDFLRDVVAHGIHNLTNDYSDDEDAYDAIDAEFRAQARALLGG